MYNLEIGLQFDNWFTDFLCKHPRGFCILEHGGSSLHCTILRTPEEFLVQLAAGAVTIVFTGVLTIVIYRIVDLFIGVRVDKKSELMGLDLTQHRERAYTVLE